VRAKHQRPLLYESNPNLRTALKERFSIDRRSTAPRRSRDGAQVCVVEGVASGRSGAPKKKW